MWMQVSYEMKSLINKKKPQKPSNKGKGSMIHLTFSNSVFIYWNWLIKYW